MIADGTASVVNGTASTADGTSSTADGTASNANGTTSNADGTAIASWDPRDKQYLCNYAFSIAVMALCTDPITSVQG